jgi:purine-binding chemotaxis protein CheW
MQNQDESHDFVDEDDDGTAQLVVFMLREQEYAVSIDNVQEITRIPEKMDKVPKTPKFIEGVVNLRGTVLPVIDMRTRFELDKMDGNERQRIIVLTIGGITTGFVVDSVAQVLRLPREQIESSPNLSEEQNRMMGRVVNLKDDKRIIQVLEADQLLSTTEIDAIEEKVA